MLKASPNPGNTKKKYDRTAKSRELEEGDQVLVRTPGLQNKLDEAWTGSWVVVRKCRPVTYEIRMQQGIKEPE